MSNAWALAFLVGAAIATVARASAPFAHGWWLVAYLVLVGALAQLLLASGGAWLVRRAGGACRPLSWRRWGLGLWNTGALAVPVGVFTSSDPAILVGSALLLAALALYVAGVPRVAPGGPRPVKRWTYAYYLLVVSLCGSVFVGAALAGALPWQ